MDLAIKREAGVQRTVTEGPTRPNPPGGRPRPPAPTADRPGSRFPEPPAFRAHPLSPARQCANCANALKTELASPRCWGCGRALCLDCYWHHDTAPATHRCTSCLARGVAGSAGLSGGHAGPLSAPIARPAR